LGLMRDAGAERVCAVTLGFDEFVGQNQDETLLAADIAEHYGAEHHIRRVGKGEFLDDVKDILAAMDQPTIDGVNTYFVSKAAHELGLKVALSGTGGDELFGGYSHFHTVPRDVALLRRLRLGVNLQSFEGVVFSPWGRSGLIEPKIEALLRYGGTFEGAYLARRCLFTPHELPGVMDLDLAQMGLARLEPLLHLSEQLPERDLSSFENIAILESTMYLRNQLLRDADWAGMAHSLEIRVPFVDSFLLRELAPHLRARSKIDKSLLALAPDLALPMHIVSRAKTGFSTPVAEWLQDAEGLGSWRQSPRLRKKGTKWAKRWAHVVSDSFFGRIK
jgi:asparagine synthase (glutamine-hydrolysing)